MTGLNHRFSERPLSDTMPRGTCRKCCVGDSGEGVKRGDLMAARRNLCKSSDSSRTASAVAAAAAVEINLPEFRGSTVMLLGTT